MIDSPPVMAVADASVLAHQTSAVLFVVGCEMTSRPAANQAVEQLLKVGATMAGGVLNKVNVGQHGYYYSHYYRGGYGEYYGRSNGNGSVRPADDPNASAEGAGGRIAP